MNGKTVSDLNLKNMTKEVQGTSLDGSSTSLSALTYLGKDVWMNEEDVLGRSGPTTVYSGFRKVGNSLQSIAIKCVTEEVNKSSREIQLQLQLESKERVVRLYNVLTHRIPGKDIYYLIMERCQYSIANRQFLTHLKSLNGTTRGHQLQSYIHDILSGLALVHEDGIAHCDISPGNILVDTDGRLKLADFGLSRSFTGQGGSQLQTVNLGTPHFVAPEILDGSICQGSGANYDNTETNGTTESKSTLESLKRADMYSTGCVIHFLCTDGAFLESKSNSYSFNFIESDCLRHLLEQLLNVNPSNRLTAQQCLQHPYFWTAEHTLSGIATIREVMGSYKIPKEVSKEVRREYNNLWKKRFIAIEQIGDRFAGIDKCKSTKSFEECFPTPLKGNWNIKRNQLVLVAKLKNAPQNTMKKIPFCLNFLIICRNILYGHIYQMIGPGPGYHFDDLSQFHQWFLHELGWLPMLVYHIANHETMHNTLVRQYGKAAHKNQNDQVMDIVTEGKDYKRDDEVPILISYESKDNQSSLPLLTNTVHVNQIRFEEAKTLLADETRAIEAAETLEELVALGYAEAMFELGCFKLKQSSVEETAIGVQLIHQAAQSVPPSPEALLKLSGFYRRGVHVVKNEHKAIDLLLQAAECGEAQAEFEASLFLQYGALHDHEGKGSTSLFTRTLCSCDRNRSLSLLHSASEKGNPRAQYLLGEMYLYGCGVPRNTPRGLDLLELAGQSGLIKANDLLSKDIHALNVIIYHAEHTWKKYRYAPIFLLALFSLFGLTLAKVDYDPWYWVLVSVAAPGMLYICFVLPLALVMFLFQVLFCFCPLLNPWRWCLLYSPDDQTHSFESTPNHGAVRDRTTLENMITDGQEQPP